MCRSRSALPVCHMQRSNGRSDFLITKGRVMFPPSVNNNNNHLSKLFHLSTKLVLLLPQLSTRSLCTLDFVAHPVVTLQHTLVNIFSSLTRRHPPCSSSTSPPLLAVLQQSLVSQNRAHPPAPAKATHAMVLLHGILKSHPLLRRYTRLHPANVF